MHFTLTESALHRGNPLSNHVVSGVAHAAILAILIAGGASISAGRLASPDVVPIQFRPLHPADPVIPRRAGRGPHGAPAVPTLATVPSLVVPSVMLSGIPDMVAPSARFDAPNFDGRALPLAGTEPAGDSLFAAIAVDKPVRPLGGNPGPRYPASLAAMGVEGSVTVRFVVDTLGMVERGSTVVLLGTHPLFERAVREVLARARYTPAESGGRKVRQLVEQTFTFAIRP